MFDTLKNNPVLRERVFGLTAIAAILIAGAACIDAMLTSGWQPPGEAHAPTVIAAETRPEYRSGLDQRQASAPLARAPTAERSASASDDVTQMSGPLDGVADSEGAAAPLSSVAPLAAPEQSAQAADERNADQRFDTIEGDVQQATTAMTADPNKTPSPS
ncbi:MAG: hypothetical protein JSS00_12000 [Proteobacteria bacterium]|nr:hypothetical protein [Pseudomonadota bacterium]